jgi:AAA15 family ATPase/GTPase
MLAKVNIKNFKSIRDLEFSPKRVNVFIGEPNTGKSNVLEALAVFSEGIYDDRGETLREVLRYKTVSDLFYDRELSEAVRIVTDGLEWSLKFESSQFQGAYLASSQNGVRFTLDHVGQLSVNQFPQSNVRYYRFKGLGNFNETRFGTLRAPFGTNLAAVLTTNKRLRSLVSDLFVQRGFKLIMDAEKNEFGMAKDINDQLRIFSYPTISETFRRIIFFMAVLETNEGTTMLLDEPETNTFPFYTKYLAERIALNESNQFCITTHNPYLLSSIVEKTPAKDLQIFVTTMDKFETKLQRVPEKKLSDLLSLDADAFFNLDKLVDE